MKTATRYALPLLTALTVTSGARAQDASAQIALRDRWRLTAELGVSASLARATVDGATARSGSPFAVLSVGLGAWRAVLPALDVGGRIGLRGPDVRDVYYPPILAACPAGEVPVSFSGEARVAGLSPFAMLGARLRPGGPSRPVHVVAGVGAALWVMPAVLDAQWRCGAPTLPVPTPSGPERSHRVGPSAGLSLLAVVGVEGHFGPSEEFSVGVEYWHDLGLTDSTQYALGLTLGYELRRGAPLPPGARGRGATAATVIGVVGGLLVLTGASALLALSGIG